MQKLGSSMDYGQEAILGLAAEGLPDLVSALPEAAASLPQPPSIPASATPAKATSNKKSSTNDLMPPPELKAIYDRVAAEQGVPVNVLVAMGHTESAHRPDIDGPQTKYGAAGGIMQYLPGMAAAHKINRYNPEESIRQAAKDLRERLAKNKGDMANAVARHHAGDNPEQLGPKSRAYAETILGKARKLADVYEAEQAAQLKGASQAREAAREQAAEAKRGEYYPQGGAKPAAGAMPSLAGNGLFGFSEQLKQARQAAPYGDLGVMNGFNAENTPAAQGRSTTPVTPEAEAQVRAALAVLPAGQREAMLQDKGWRGQVARTIWAESEGAKKLQRTTGIGPKVGAANPIVTRDEIEASYRKSGYTPGQAAQLAVHDLAGHTDQVRASNFDFEGMQAARDNLLVQAGRDVRRGASNLRAMSEGLAGTVYGLMGEDDAARSALEVATARMEKTARENPALVGSYENIHGADDAVRYAVEAVAENLPMFLPSMVSGGAGGLVARKAAQGIVGDMVAKVGRDRALKELERRIMIGQVTGAATSSVGMETGSIAGDIYQKTGRAEPWLALAAGIPAGMLDTVEPVMALRKIAGPIADGVAGSIIKRLGTESGKQFMAEAGTEGLQTIIENAAVLSAQNKQPLTPELLDGVVDAMLKGGIGGGVMGAGSEAVSSLRHGSRQPALDYGAATKAAFGDPQSIQQATGAVPGGPIGRAVSKAQAAPAVPSAEADEVLDRPPIDEPMFMSAKQAPVEGGASATEDAQAPAIPAWGHQLGAELASQPIEVGRKENFAADYPVPPAPDAAAIADVDARVAAAREQESAAQRRQILDGVLADTAVRNPVAKFSAELARAGYSQAMPSADELATIERFSAVKDTFTSIDPDATPQAPAAPNAMGDDEAVDWRAQRDAEIMGEAEGDGLAPPAQKMQPAPVAQTEGDGLASPSAPMSLTAEQAAIADQSRAANQFIKLLRKAGQPVNDERAMVALWKAHKAKAAEQQGVAPATTEAQPAPSQPVPQPKQPSAATAKLPKPNNWHKKAAQVDIERDTVRDAVARLGGIRKDEAMREWGATLVEGAKSRIFGKPVFRAKGGTGMPLDKMREALAELGYLPPDSDINDLYQAFEQDSLHHVGQERRAGEMAQQAASESAALEGGGQDAAASAPERTLDNHPVYDPWYDFDPDAILPDDLNEAAASAGEVVSEEDAEMFQAITTKLHQVLGADEAESITERAAIMADSGKNFFEAVLELINGRQEAESNTGAAEPAAESSKAAEASARPTGARTASDIQQERPDAGRSAAEAGQPGGDDAGILQSYDQAELDAREQAQRAAEARRQEEERAADRKRQADAEVGDFVLTGSDTMADQLAARGQGGLFDAPSTAPSIEQPAPNTSADDSTAADGAVAAKAEPPDFPTKEIADSYRHISHRGSDSAKAEETAFNQSVEQIRSEVGPMAETEAQQAAFDSAMADYQRGYIDASLKVARAREGTMSPLVAGRNNFNGKQAARTGSAYEKAQDEFARKVSRLKAAVEQAVRDARTPEQVQAEQDKAAEKARKKSILDFAKAAGAIADDLRNNRKAMAGDTRKWANKDMMAQLDGMDEATQRQAIEGSDKALKELGGLAVVVGPRSALGRRVSGMLATYAAESTTETKSEQSPKSTESEVSEPSDDIQQEQEPADFDAPLTVEAFDDFISRLWNGKVKVDELKARFAAFKRDQDLLQAELSKKTKEALLQIVGGHRAASLKNEKKSRVIDAALSSMLDEFVLGDSYSYSLGGRMASIEAKVGSYTQDDLDGYAARIAKLREERSAALEQFQSGLENPQTLDDYRNVMRSRMADGTSQREAFLSLTPGQREQYDSLAAEATREAREARQRAAKAVVEAAKQQTGAKVLETKHTRDGYDLFVVQLDERVDRDSYNTLNANAKRMGGWYSKFRGNGAIPGFQFKDRASADAFAKLVQGDSSAAADAVSARRDAFEDDKSQSAAERLRTMADRLDEIADESLGRERKANTARRANFAAAAEAQAFGQKAQATTMRRLADAIESGSSKFLGQVRQKVQIEALDAFLSQAKWDYLQAKYGNNWHANKDVRAGKELADYAAFPSYTAWASDLATLARQLLQLDGGKRLGERLQSVADDVTEEYLQFVKDNLRKVSTFSRIDGSGAEFSSKQAAEVAIRRSGLKDKAIAYSPKRGQHIIVMSPKAANEAGLFQSQNKRITLSVEFSTELLEKMRQHPKELYQLHSLLIADERRKRLAGMGILTPMELRAALREYMDLREPAKAADKVKEMERAMVGRKADGLDFFPTPADTAQRMIELAELTPEMRVLEPSAGMGHIAEKIRAAGIEPDVVEYSADRRELLEAKGFNVVGNDFLELAGEYDRIVMNPPFSNRRDAEHVQHAYSLLKPGGRIVAIMGEGVFFGQDKKAQAFRDWLDEVGGTSEQLEEGTFLDSSLPVNTGVNARLVVIDKNASGGLPDGARFSIAEAGTLSSAAETPGKDLAFHFRTETGKPFTGGLKVDAVQVVIGDVTRGWKNLPAIEAVQGFDELPAEIQQECRRQGGNEYSVQGILSRKSNKVYVIAGNHEWAREVEATLFHEIIGHYGLGILTSDDAGEVQAEHLRLFKMVGGRGELMEMAARFGVAKDIESYRKSLEKSNWSQATQAAILFDELIAHIAEKQPSGWKHALRLAHGYLRSFLRQAGFKRLATLTDADVSVLVNEAARAVRSSAKSASKRASKMSIANAQAGLPLSIEDLHDVFRQSPLGGWVDRLIASGRLTIKPNLVLPEGYKHLEATQAFTVDGNITMFAGNIGGRQRVMPVLLHEVFHSSGEALLGGKEWGKLIAELDQLRQHAEANPAGKAGKLWNDAKRRVQEAIDNGDNMSQADMAEELGAYAIELADQAPLTWQRWVDRLLGHVKAWARRVLGLQLGRLTPEQLRALAIAALRDGSTTAGRGPRLSMRDKEVISMKEGNFPGADSRDSNIALGRDAQRRLLSEHPTWAQRLRDIGLKGLRPTLSVLPGNTVVDLYRDKLPALELAQKQGERLDGMRQTLQKEADETFRAWEKLPAEAADKMADLMHEATIWQLHPDQPAPKKLSKKWAAKHAQLAADWAALPTEAQAVYRQVRDLYAKRTEQMFDALADRVGRMSGLGTGSRSKMLADLRERFDKTLGEGPYFPLSRFGDYLVVAKRLDGDGKTLEKVVLAAETEHEQRILQQDLLGRGFDVVELDKAAKNFRASSLGNDLSGFAAGLIDKLDGVEMSDDQRADILDDINQMLIDALPPASARKHFKHRKGVPGFSNDAVRAFVRSQASMASHIANITYQDRIDKALQDARKQAKQDQANVNELGSVVDEMEERAELARRFVAHPIANALTQLGFANFLGFSLSQGLLNLTQVPLLTYPALAAKFGEAKTHAALRGAYAKVGRALTKKGGETWGDVRTLEDLDDDSKRILKAMEERGKLDLTMALDLVRGGAGPQAPGRHVATRAAQWVGRYSGWFNHISEAANRQVTAIAGYKLALGQGMNRDQAVDYVAKLLDESQFNYAFSNRPRLLMSNAGRVIGLMHTFAINAMYRIGRNLYHAMGSWKTDEGREARSIMLRILTVQMALAGLSSLPLLPLAGAAAGTAIHKATGSRVLGAVGVMAGVGLAQALVSGMGADDDEPWDFDAERRRILNDITGSRTIAELLDKGLLRALGMDVANRISMNDLLMRDVDTGFTSKPAQTWLDNAFLQSIGGAAYGAIKQYARATDMAMDGQYHRAVEAALPKFAADVLKASRYAREDVRVPVGPASAHKADATAFDVARQALGFTPSTVAEVNSSERAQRKAVAQMQARRGELLEAWVVARLEKNSEAEKGAVARITKFNQTQRENGSVDLIITGADRMAKLRSQKRSVERREDGQQFGRKYRGIAESAGGMYGEE